MQTNLHDYDTRASWTPPQNQPYTGRYVTSPDGRPQFVPQAPQRPTGQKPKGPQKMPKAQAMALADRLKRAVAVASFIGFGTFSGLATLHQVGTTTTQSTQSSSGSSSSNSSNSTNSSSSSSQSSNNFLNQQGGNTGGTSSSSSTVSGTHTS